SLLGKVLEDSPIDSLFYNSLSQMKPILVTLSNRKVYVGIVNKLGEPNESTLPNQEISIVPLLSGFRSSDDLKIKFTNDYKEFEGKETDISTIIVVSEIECASWFDPDIYLKINGNYGDNSRQ
ncbi:hypothetical protein L1D59_23555, partial [Pseudoalteromonas piscicida]|nr:hypothetical protein [Pseudoalteromonas piscicida]